MGCGQAPRYIQVQMQFSLHERISLVCRKHLASDILHLHGNRSKYTLMLPLSTISNSEYINFNLLSCAHQVLVLTSMPITLHPHSFLLSPMHSIPLHVPESHHSPPLNPQPSSRHRIHKSPPTVKTAPTTRHPFHVLTARIAFHASYSPRISVSPPHKYMNKQNRPGFMFIASLTPSYKPLFNPHFAFP